MTLGDADCRGKLVRIVCGGDRPFTAGIPLDTALPGALNVAEIDATMAYAEDEKAMAQQ